MTLDELATRSGEWLRGCGPESDIVMSSRIRLARNLANYPFVRRCTDIDRANIQAAILGPGETIPVRNGELLLGRWQAVMLAELDGPRERRIIVTLR